MEHSNECIEANNLYNVGTLMTRGPHVIQKYWGQNDSTIVALSENGWLNTGDVGWIDEDGRLWLLGRSKDMIKSGGEIFYPSEVSVSLLAQCQLIIASSIVKLYP